LAKFRIETETDLKTGKVYAEFYNPDDVEQPLVSCPLWVESSISIFIVMYVRLRWKADV